MNLLLIGDVGGWPTYHVGDEAMLESNLAWLSGMASGGRIEMISQDPVWSAGHYGTPCVESARFPEVADHARYNALIQEAERCAARNGAPADRPNRALPLDPVVARLERIAESLLNSDALVILGGGNLCSSWPHLLYERIALMRMARRLGKKIIVLGQTVGPKLLDSEHALLVDVLRDAKIIVLRDIQSYGLLRSADVPSHQLIYDVDDAFSLAPKPSEREVASQNGRPWIAVTFTTFVDPVEQPHVVQALAAQLNLMQKKTGCGLVFIPHVGLARGTFPDAVMGEALAKLLRGRMQVMHLRVASEVRWLTGQASMIISSRYHPLVFGLAANVPGLGLYTDGYSQAKLEGALDHASLRRWVLPLSDSLAGGLAEQAINLWQARESVSAQLRDRQPSLLAKHNQRWQRIADILTAA
jgi:polysaccharide pyruvyl transferase WcaK-like protein